MSSEVLLRHLFSFIIDVRRMWRARGSQFVSGNFWCRSPPRWHLLLPGCQEFGRGEEVYDGGPRFGVGLSGTRLMCRPIHIPGDLPKRPGEGSAGASGEHQVGGLLLSRGRTGERRLGCWGPESHGRTGAGRVQAEAAVSYHECRGHACLTLVFGQGVKNFHGMHH